MGFLDIILGRKNATIDEVVQAEDGLEARETELKAKLNDVGRRLFAAKQREISGHGEEGAVERLLKERADLTLELEALKDGQRKLREGALRQLEADRQSEIQVTEGRIKEAEQRYKETKGLFFDSLALLSVVMAELWGGNPNLSPDIPHSIVFTNRETYMAAVASHQEELGFGSGRSAEDDLRHWNVKLKRIREKPITDVELEARMVQIRASAAAEAAEDAEEAVEDVEKAG